MVDGLSLNKSIVIRREEEKDYKRVEEITRKAFWNLYVRVRGTLFGTHHAVP